MTLSTGTIVLSVFMALGGLMAVAAIGTHVYEIRYASLKKKAKKVADDEEKARQSLSMSTSKGGPSFAGSGFRGPNPMSPIGAFSTMPHSPAMNNLHSSPTSPQTPILHIASPVSPSPVHSPTTPVTPYTSTGLFRPVSDSDSRPLLSKSPTTSGPVFSNNRSVASNSTNKVDKFTSPPPPMNLSRLRQFTTPPRGLKRAPGLSSKKENKAAALEGEDAPPRFILARSVSELVGRPVTARARVPDEERQVSDTRETVDRTEGNMQEVGRFGW